MTDRRNDFIDRYNWRINWLYKQWGEGIQPTAESLEYKDERLENKTQKILRDGKMIILRNGKTYTASGTLIGDL